MPLILWSGGGDSTLLLLQALEKQRKENSEPVRTFSVHHYAVTQSDIEFTTRDILQHILRERGFFFHRTEIKVIRGSGDDPVQEGNVQTQLWIGMVCPFLKKEENLQVGYLDKETEYWRDAETAFNALRSMTYKTGSIEFPLRRWAKHHVIEELKRLDLLQYTWWCEDPYRKSKAPEACGECGSCITHITAEWQLERFPRQARYG